MSETMVSATIALERQKAQQHSADVKADNKKSAQQAGDENALLYAFTQILVSAHLQVNTADVHADALEANTASQQKLIDELSQIHYQSIDQSLVNRMNAVEFQKNAQKATNELHEINDQIDLIQWANEKISAHRSTVTNEYSLGKQAASVQETELTTDTNRFQEDLQIDGQIAQLYGNITRPITQM